MCGLTLSSLFQDAEDRVIGGGSVDVLQDLVHGGGVGTAGQHHPLLIFGADIHPAEDPAPPPASDTNQHQPQVFNSFNKFTVETNRNLKRRWLQVKWVSPGFHH